MADACMCSASQGKDLNFRDRLKRTPSTYHGLAALSSLPPLPTSLTFREMEPLSLLRDRSADREMVRSMLSEAEVLPESESPLDRLPGNGAEESKLPLVSFSSVKFSRWLLSGRSAMLLLSLLPDLGFLSPSVEFPICPGCEMMSGLPEVVFPSSGPEGAELTRVFVAWLFTSLSLSLLSPSSGALPPCPFAVSLPVPTGPLTVLGEEESGGFSPSKLSWLTSEGSLLCFPGGCKDNEGKMLGFASPL